MSETLSVPLHHVEIGDEFWMERSEATTLAEWAFFFTVSEYDGDYCKVEITGHGDE